MFLSPKIKFLGCCFYLGCITFLYPGISIALPLNQPEVFIYTVSTMWIYLFVAFGFIGCAFVYFSLSTWRKVNKLEKEIMAFTKKSQPTELGA